MPDRLKREFLILGWDDDIDAIGIMIVLLEELTETGREAALAFLNSRYKQEGVK